MTIRKIHGATSSVVVSATTIRTGIFKATAAQQSGINSLRNLSSVLIPKATNEITSSIKRLIYDPDGQGARNLREYLGIPDFTRLLITKANSDTANILEEILLRVFRGRSEIDSVSLTDQIIVALVSGQFRVFNESIEALDYVIISRILPAFIEQLSADSRTTLFVDKSFADIAGVEDLTGVYDGITYNTIITKQDTAEMQDFLARTFTAVRSGEGFADEAGMQDALAYLAGLSLRDVATNLDRIQTLTNYFRPFADDTIVLDRSNILFDAVKAETIGTDLDDQTLAFFKYLADTTTMLDQAAITDGLQYDGTKTLTDAIGLSDAKQLLVSKPLSNELSLGDFMFMARVKGLFDAIGADDDSQLFAQLSKSDVLAALDYNYLNVGKLLADAASSDDQIYKDFSKLINDDPVALDNSYRFVDKYNQDIIENFESIFFDVAKTADADNVDATERDYLTLSKLVDPSSVAVTDAKTIAYIIKGLSDIAGVEDLTGIFDGITYNTIITKQDTVLIEEYFARTVRFIRGVRDGFRETITPISGPSKQFLLEAKAAAFTDYQLLRTNYVTFSEQFDQWNKFNVYVTSNAQSAPTNVDRLSSLPLSDADKIVATTDNTSHLVRSAIIPTTVGQEFSFGIYLQYGGNRLVEIGVNDAYLQVETNLGKKAVYDMYSSPNVIKVNESPDIWYCTFKGTITTSQTTVYVQLYGEPMLGQNYVFPGDGINGVYAWGAQLEVNDAGQSPQETDIGPTYVATSGVAAQAYGLNHMPMDLDRVYVGAMQRTSGLQRLTQDAGETTTFLIGSNKYETLTIEDYFDRDVRFYRIFEEATPTGRSEGFRVSGDDQERLSYVLTMDARASVDFTLTGYYDIGYGHRDSTIDANRILEMANGSDKTNYYNPTWYSPVPLDYRAGIVEFLTSTTLSAHDTDRTIIFDRFTRIAVTNRVFEDLSTVADFSPLLISKPFTEDLTSTDVEPVKFFNKGIFDTKLYYRQHDDDAALLNELFYNQGLSTDPQLVPLAGTTTYRDQYNWYSIVPLTDHGAQFAYGTNNGLGVEILDHVPKWFDKRFDETYPWPGQGNNLGPLMIDQFSFGDQFTYDFLLYEPDTVIAGGDAGFRGNRGDAEAMEFYVHKIGLTGLGADRTVSGTTVTAADGDRLFVGQQYGDVRLSGDPLENFNFVMTMDAKAGVDFVIEGTYDIGWLYRDAVFDANQIVEVNNITNKLNNYNPTWYSDIPLTSRYGITDLNTSTTITAADLDRVIAFDKINFLLSQLRNLLEDQFIEDFVSLGPDLGKFEDVAASDIEPVKFFNKGIIDTKSYYRQHDDDAALLNELFYNQGLATDPQLVPIDGGSTTYRDTYNWYSIVPLTDHGANFAFGTNNGLGVEALESKAFWIDKRFDETYPWPGQGSNLGPLMIDQFSFGDQFTYDFILGEFDFIIPGGDGGFRGNRGDAEAMEFIVLKNALTGLGADRTVSGTTVTAADTDRVLVGQQYGDQRFAGDPLENLSYIMALDARAGVDFTIAGTYDIGWLYRDSVFDANQVAEINNITNKLNNYNPTWYSDIPLTSRYGITDLDTSTTITARDLDRVIAFDKINFLLAQLRNLFEDVLAEDFISIGPDLGKFETIEATDVAPTKFINKGIIDTKSYYRQHDDDAALLNELFYNQGLATDPQLVPIDGGSTTYRDATNWYSIVPLTDHGASFAYGTNNGLGVEALEDSTYWANKFLSSNHVVIGIQPRDLRYPANYAMQPASVITNDIMAFGKSMDRYGSYVIVGAPFAAISDPSVDGYNGKAYVFRVTQTGATVLHTITDPNPTIVDTTGDEFGRFVAINESWFVVGAPYEDTSALNSDSGRVYVYSYTETSYTLVYTLLDANAYGTREFDSFGYGLTLSGNYLFVGSLEWSGTYNGGGVVYVYDLTTGTKLYNIDNPANLGDGVDESGFGASIKVSGNYVIIDAPFNNDTINTAVGNAYVYSWNATTATLVHTLSNPAPVGNYYDTFGERVAIGEEYIAVAAPGKSSSAGVVYIYKYTGTTTSLLHTITDPNAYGTPGDYYAPWGESFGDRFGIGLALDGNRLAIGANSEDPFPNSPGPRYEWDSGDNSGMVYVYEFDDSSVTLIRQLVEPVTPFNSNNNFGYAMHLSGNTLLVGVPGGDISTSSDTLAYADAGKVYYYDISRPLPNERLGSDPAEATWFFVNKDLADTTTMVDSFSFGDNLTYDFALYEPDFVTIGRSEGKKVSGSPLENLSYIMALDARAGVDFTIAGSYDIGWLDRDPILDAQAIQELNNVTNDLNYYNPTWYSPVPLTARYGIAGTEYSTSTALTSRDTDRIIAFDKIGFLLAQLRNLFDTTEALDAISLGPNKGLADEVTVTNDDDPVVFVDKAISEGKSFSRQATADVNLLNEFFFDEAISTDPQLLPVSGTTTYKNKYNWYSIVPLTERGASFAYGTNNDLAVNMLEDLHYYSDTHMKDDPFSVGGTSGTRSNNLDLESTAFYTILRPRKGAQTDIYIDVVPSVTEDANQVMDMFVNQPSNVYAKNWFQLAPYYDSYGHVIDTEADPDNVRVGAQHDGIRWAGNKLEITAFDFNKKLDSVPTMIENIGLGNSLFVKSGIRNDLQPVDRINRLEYSEDFNNSAWTTLGISITSTSTVLSKNLPYRNVAYDANQIMEMFVNQPNTYELYDWYRLVHEPLQSSFTSNGIGALIVSSSNTRHYMSASTDLGSENYFSISMFVSNLQGVTKVRLDAGIEGDVAHYADFNISTGELITSTNVTYASIQHVGEGWYLLKILGPVQGTADFVPTNDLDMLGDPELEYGTADLSTDYILPIPLDLA